MDHQASRKLAQSPSGRREQLKNGSFNAAPRGGEGKYGNETHHASCLRTPAECFAIFLFQLFIILAIIVVLIFIFEDENDDEHEEDFSKCLKPT